MTWTLSGYKAYLVGVLMIVLGLLQGDDKLALEGLSVIALRAGIAKGEVR